MNSPVNFVFFGSSRLSVIVLDELEKLGFTPSCVVTTPDKPQGRKLIMTPNVVKSWATARNIETLDPTKIDASSIDQLKAKNADVFVVASYGKILPSALIDIPRGKTLNIHPSLLPLYRGASPLPSAMLDDAKKTGVSIMRIDAEMDHGPLVAQKEVTITEWPTYEDFEESMAKEGAQLLASILPEWVAGTITEKEQDHSMATYTEKIKKEDGLLDLSADPYLNYRKIQAYHSWPQAYFMIERDSKPVKVKITQASYVDGKLIIEKVIPEGKKEMNYLDFKSGYLI